MKLKYSYIWIILLAGIASCRPDRATKDGYQRLATGVRYQIFPNATSNDLPREGNYVRFHATVMQGEAVVSTTYTDGQPSERLIAAQAEAEGVPVLKLLQKMHVGDSAVLLIDTDSLLKIPSPFKAGEVMKMTFKVVSILTAETKRFEREALLATFEPKPEASYYVKPKVESTATRKPQVGELVDVNLTMRRYGKVMAKSGDVGVPTQLPISDDPASLTALMHAIREMSVGDSITVAIKVEDMPTVPKGFVAGDVVEIDVRLLAIKKPK